METVREEQVSGTDVQPDQPLDDRARDEQGRFVAAEAEPAPEGRESEAEHFSRHLKPAAPPEPEDEPTDLEKLRKENLALLKFYRREGDGHDLNPEVWGEIFRARQNGDSTPAVEEALRVESELRTAQQIGREVADAIPPTPAPAPVSDEQARLALAHWQGRHELARENLNVRVQSILEKEPELANAADRIELSAPLLNDLGEVLAEVGNGEQVFRFLTANPKHFEAMTSPQTLIATVGKISAALEFGTLPGVAERPATRAPRPPEPVHGASRDATGLSDDLPPDEWGRRFLARLEKRKNR